VMWETHNVALLVFSLRLVQGQYGGSKVLLLERITINSFPDVVVLSFFFRCKAVATRLSQSKALALHEESLDTSMRDDSDVAVRSGKFYEPSSHSFSTRSSSFSAMLGIVPLFITLGEVELGKV